MRATRDSVLTRRGGRERYDPKYVRRSRSAPKREELWELACDISSWFASSPSPGSAVTGNESPVSSPCCGWNTDRRDNDVGPIILSPSTAGAPSFGVRHRHLRPRPPTRLTRISLEAADYILHCIYRWKGSLIWTHTHVIATCERKGRERFVPEIIKYHRGLFSSGYVTSFMATSCLPDCACGRRMWRKYAQATHHHDLGVRECTSYLTIILELPCTAD